MSYSTIDKPTDYFNTKLYTGNGSTQSITGVGFQPDWVWIKDRDSASSHRLIDGVRGVYKKLFSNSTTAEVNDVNSLTSFTSDGFDSGSDSGMNGSGINFVSWNWLASNTTASNTDGTITSTVSANTTSGFSIVSYTGTGANATVGHGLGVAPKMIILKERNPATTRSWRVYHEDVGNNKVLYLDLTNAETSDTTAFNSTSPTSSVFSLGTSAGTNSSKNYIAYCFADVKGYSKFGSYTGNANDNGTFSYTGFKPAWVMIKRTDVIKNWYLIDNKRENYNPNHETTILFANSSNAEQTLPDREVDFLSNGFKLRGSDGDVNASGGTYIYMAFAENPLVGSNFVPNNAR